MSIELLSKPDDIDNNHRAARAQLALEVHKAQQNVDYSYAEDHDDSTIIPETQVMELLTDLLHYCNVHDVSFAHALKHARMNYDDEFDPLW